MSKVLLDTHVVVWHLLDSPRLSHDVKCRIEDALASDGVLAASISILEVGYLVEKGRLPVEAFDKFVAIVSNPGSGFRVVPLDSEDAIVATKKIARESIPDMPDRIIAVSALMLGVPLVTHDSKIRAAGLNVIH